MKQRRHPDDIDDLIDTALALVVLWLLMDPERVLTIPISLALTMGWFAAYRVTLSDEGPR